MFWPELLVVMIIHGRKSQFLADINLPAISFLDLMCLIWKQNNCFLSIDERCLSLHWSYHSSIYIKGKSVSWLLGKDIGIYPFGVDSFSDALNCWTLYKGKRVSGHYYITIIYLVYVAWTLSFSAMSCQTWHGIRVGMGYVSTYWTFGNLTRRYNVW